MKYEVFLIGVAFLVTWLLIAVFAVTVEKSILVTAIIFMLLGVIWAHPWEGR